VVVDAAWTQETTIVEQILSEETHRPVIVQLQTSIEIQQANNGGFLVEPWPNGPVPEGRMAVFVIIHAGESSSAIQFEVTLCRYGVSIPRGETERISDIISCRGGVDLIEPGIDVIAVEAQAPLIPQIASQTPFNSRDPRVAGIAMM